MLFFWERKKVYGDRGESKKYFSACFFVDILQNTSESSCYLINGIGCRQTHLFGGRVSNNFQNFDNIVFFFFCQLNFGVIGLWPVFVLLSMKQKQHLFLLLASNKRGFSFCYFSKNNSLFSFVLQALRMGFLWCKNERFRGRSGKEFKWERECWIFKPLAFETVNTFQHVLFVFFFFNISVSKIFSRSGPLENGYAERAAAQPLFLTLSYFVFVLLLWSPPENRNTVLGFNQLTWLSLLRGFLNTFLWNWVFSLRCVPMTSDLVEFFLDQFFDHIFSYVFLWKCF